ncbi:hypothetical protein GNP44_18845 [Aliivibrio fischeri]|uniref:DUF6338 family protein n=1 Tax=Aliivibrio fischeri TaxID=668 RepID=UPI0012D8B941|nr:DUF6338 family protein [Aliivibrio fischeri]MUK32128.1 hypothetical protein [Aliivibrio fischeri]
MSIWEVDKLLIFIGFVIPGFISIKVFDLLHPSESIDSTKKVIEAVTYSCFNYALLFIPMYFIETMEVKNNSPILYGLFYLFVLFIFPVLIAFAISKIRLCDFVQKKAPHPIKMPWDFVFKQRQWYWVIVELKDGTKVGGKYAEHSFTSSYPAPEQIYLEEKWVLDEDDSFERVRGGTAGVLIAADQIATIELFKFDNGENNEQ